MGGAVYAVQGGRHDQQLCKLHAFTSHGHTDTLMAKTIHCLHVYTLGGGGMACMACMVIDTRGCAQVQSSAGQDNGQDNPLSTCTYTKGEGCVCMVIDTRGQR